MGRDSHHRRKRKTDKHENDSSDENKQRSLSRSPERKSRRTDKGKRKAKSPGTPSSNKNEESISIEETNRLRASLGLAPLEVDSGPKEREVEGSDGVEKIYKEDGMEFVHKKAEHLGEKKRVEEMREKLSVARDKRKLYEKVLKVKPLAESDSDEDASSWVAKNRELEEERKRAEERAKILDDMDADFGVNALINEENKMKQIKKAKKREQKSDLAGLMVGHAKEDFLEGSETILVLEDKGVLDEGEEVLVNTNLAENHRYQKNVELKRKKNRYEPYEEEFDEYGMPKEKGLLSKYDELEGEAKKAFRLGEAGEVDIDKEREEMEMRRKLFMANKKLESLELPKYTVASEFYTEEEMLSFRRPKSKKDKKLRKRKEKMLKADDLIPDESALADDAERAAKAINRQCSDGFEVKEEEKVVKDKPNLEEGELADEDEKKGNWRCAETSAFVDVQNLNKLAKQVEEEEDDEDDDLVGGVDLSNVVIEDDAEEELTVMLDRARKLRQHEIKKENPESDAALKMHELMKIHSVKEEPMDVEEENDKCGVVIDSTMEYCRNLGEIPTYGLAGNRQDAVDVRELNEPEAVKIEVDEEAVADYSPAEENRNHRRSEQEIKGKWTEATASTSAYDDKKTKKLNGESDDSDDEAYNVLGEERDVTKGVAAMLKSAAEKGYLDAGKERKVKGPSLKHLESKRFSQIETSRYDIEEKYTKKLERMGTTGTGPVRPFPEKADYKPDIRITYVDERGKEMESKDAFRVLSWKFHGKGPGKKQIEKRQAKQEKKELMKKMNSMDTPLGTLNKQLKKQEAMQTPYIILSGSGRDTGAPLKKE
ncbi:SART-1 family protein [Brugia malayi]|uniref:Bm3450 n=1 Tax=Brugia malayi TaxID=6279 RepID=A0A0H5S3J9_BRUMA|nr:SART-1 family protein [Brugia malayi]CRZ23250.1 Bm3450 [Brugia malayi]VIO99433.1 SART-1 family protein [Brugia malayi]